MFTKLSNLFQFHQNIQNGKQYRIFFHTDAVFTATMANLFQTLTGKTISESIHKYHVPEKNLSGLILTIDFWSDTGETASITLSPKDRTDVSEFGFDPCEISMYRHTVTAWLQCYRLEHPKDADKIPAILDTIWQPEN